jgi:translation initiation factor 3 subunit L
MAQQRLALWNAEDDLEEDVDLLTIGNYGQNLQYEDGEFSFSFLIYIVKNSVMG